MPSGLRPGLSAVFRKQFSLRLDALHPVVVSFEVVWLFWTAPIVNL